MAQDKLATHVAIVRTALETASRKAKNKEVRSAAAQRAAAALLIEKRSAPKAVLKQVHLSCSRERVTQIAAHAVEGNWETVVDLGVDAISVLPGDPI